MAGGPTALTLIARTSATGAQPLSLRARFPRPRPPMKKIPLAAADPDRLDTWVKYREGLCGECNATCCTLPVEVRIDDLIRMRLVDEFEREEPAKRIAKRLEKDGVIEHFNHKREIFTLTRMANGDCLYLDLHRAHLRHNAVRMLGGVEYLKIDERGLLIRVDGEERWLEVDNVVICAGQEPLRELQISQAAESLRFHLIGGARVAGELDAKRAIREGAMLAARL